MILVTCTISSFVTEKAARELVTKQQQDDYLKDKIDTGEERILIPIANPDTIENLVNNTFEKISGKKIRERILGCEQ